jgi:DNA mismatch repair protein MutS
MLITGPNMAGKSTYMRQVALITIMAQIGSFVPASEAKIGIVDKVFTRVGASDDLASGQSTFMLEMNEVAYILKNATKRSLIIYDEVGRGTSTFDGMSIARAIAEYTCSKKIGAKTLFATHYHELTSLEGECEGVVNYNIAAKKRGDNITFLRKIVRGSTDDSYGIEVAKLAGIPNEVIKRAREVLTEVEAASKAVKNAVAKDKPAEEKDDSVISIEDMINSQVIEELRGTDINTLSPYEAMSLLYSLQKKLKI